MGNDVENLVSIEGISAEGVEDQDIINIFRLKGNPKADQKEVVFFKTLV